MKVLHWLNDNLEKAIIIAVTSLMLAMLAASVFSRYAINVSISWAEELSIFCMVWLTYFGSSYAAMQRRHIRITIFSDMFSQKNRKIIDICVNMVFILFLLLLIYGSFKMTMLALETNQRASASGFPRWIAIASLPGAFALTIFRLVQDTRKLAAEYKILASGGTLTESGPVVSIKMEE